MKLRKSDFFDFEEAPDTLNTVQLSGWLDRLRHGDKADRDAVRDEIVNHSKRRLMRLLTKMLRGEQRILRWIETDDILNEIHMSLLDALESEHPLSTTHFFRLAGQKIRWKLRDLGRRFYGPEGIGAKHESAAVNKEGDVVSSNEPCVPPSQDGRSLVQFHDMVAGLPEIEREVIDRCLLFGMNFSEAARDLGLTHTAVRKRLNRAVLKLRVLFEDPVQS